MKAINKMPAPSPNTPTFGAYIRAARLGYHWTPQHGAFFRMSDDAGQICVDVSPCNQVPAGRSHGMYRVWWESERGVDLIDDIPGLRNLKQCKKPFVLYFDSEMELESREIGRTLR